MKRTILIALFVNLLSPWIPGQRGGPPRRLDNPVNYTLPGGSRVEFVEFKSPSLGRKAHYSLLLPPSYFQGNQRFPVIYFLHGMWNDHTSWTVQRYGNIPEKLEQLMKSGRIPEFIAVHPDGENSFYTDYLDGSLQYEKMVWRDLPEEVDHRYRTRRERRYRSIGGVSMGGYGAIKIALKHPGLYASAVGFSPIVLLGDDPSRQIMNPTSRLADYLAEVLKPIYGMPFNPDHWEANSLTHLVKSVQPRGLGIFLAWGTADRYNDLFPMERGVRTLDRLLSERGIDHVFKVYEGGPHGWGLVVQHLEEVLEFLTRTF